LARERSYEETAGKFIERMRAYITMDGGYFKHLM